MASTTVAPFRQGRHGQDQPCLAAVDHDGHGIGRSQFVDQHGECPLHQPQPILLVHGAGDVDDEGQRNILPFFRRYVVALDADAQQPGMARVVDEGRRCPSITMLKVSSRPGSG